MLMSERGNGAARRPIRSQGLRSLIIVDSIINEFYYENTPTSGYSRALLSAVISKKLVRKQQFCGNIRPPRIKKVQNYENIKFLLQDDRRNRV